MAHRINPLWWPVLAVASPVLLPLLMRRNRVFVENRTKSEESNRSRIQGANKLALPPLDFVEITVLAEWKTREGFLGEPGVSYLVKTPEGSLLFDVGFGAENRTLAHNAAKLGVRLAQVDAVALSHLHVDHIGGMAAARTKCLAVPAELGEANGKPCYLPEAATAEGFAAEIVERPKILAAGIGTTGPLARSLFFLGLCEEQALVANIRNKGLVVITGCGHPTIEVILEMVCHLSDEPLYAIAGGLHFPVTESRFQRLGIQLQMFFGTGKPPWQRIGNDDLSRTIDTINEAGPKKVLLSAHDTCDHALARLSDELNAETTVLEAGETYRI
jgi:7,8-dihydropterin-6-yl-methyl-4-(beta-D-ribofuranosyl)aminobenzene 5'-phosphate synthase